MKPNWVLSDEQCRIRFRNVRQEKQEKEKEIKGIKEEKDVEELQRMDSFGGDGGDTILIKNEQQSPLPTGDLKLSFNKKACKIKEFEKPFEHCKISDTFHSAQDSCL